MAVSKIGDLRTVRQTYTQVMTHSTSKHPEGWAAAIPGAEGIVENATKNTVLMSLVAEVEAGVDLKNAKVSEPVPGKVIVTLPKARVYRPQIQANVEQATNGIFWRDPNVSIDAIKTAEQTFRETAVRAGILKLAENSALEQVRALLPANATVTIVGS